ncbi:MAG TPA: hypothetical protein VKU00_21205 [Chthonomonadaceae bacterium]|nr:hypothetical protein [Chthonomonadaceae bacterium]
MPGDRNSLLKATAAATPLPQAHRLCIEIAGCRFWLEVDTLEGRERLEQVWQRYVAPAGADAPCGIRIQLSGTETPCIHVESKGRLVDIAEFFIGPEAKRFERVEHPTHTLYRDTVYGGAPVLESREGKGLVLPGSAWSSSGWAYFVLLLVMWRMLREYPVLTLHGAVSSAAGLALVLVGPSGAGKSTLSMAMAQQGATYYGDELAFFTLNDRHLHVWRRDLYLRPGGVQALGSAPEDFTWAESKPNDPKCVMTLQEPERPCPRNRVQFIFMDGFAEKAALHPLEGGEAARRLLKGAAYGDPSVVARLEAVSALVNQYPCWRLAVGKPSQTAALLLAHARSLA